MPSTSKSEVSAERSWLEQRYAALSEQVDLLDSRRALTSDEEMELHRLKKEKLRAKDALNALAR